MQANYPAEFTREHGCSEPEWLRCLAGAVRDHRLTLDAPGAATVAIGGHSPGGESGGGDGAGPLNTVGTLHLQWRILPPRSTTSLVVLPRLSVSYRFDGLDSAERYAFMRYFDLYMLRGGG